MHDKLKNVTRVAIVGHGHDILAIRALHRIPNDIEIICVNDPSEIPGFIPEDMPVLRELLNLEMARLHDVDFILEEKPKYKSWQRPYKYHK